MQRFKAEATRRAHVALCVLVLVPAGVCRAAGATTPVKPPTFTASYSVAWHGITAGTSTLLLKQTAPGQYRYTSTDHAHGLFRLFIPHAIRQESLFRISDGQIQPLSFKSEGGGPPEDVQFDWTRARVSGTAKNKHIDLRLQPGTQDVGSVQIALMLELLAGRTPKSFWMLNTDEIDQFFYERRGEKTLNTPLGALHTVEYTSHHPGSDRTLYLWLAPSLDYLPARVEQHRGDGVLFSLSILTFKRTGPSVSGATGGDHPAHH